MKSPLRFVLATSILSLALPAMAQLTLESAISEGLGTSPEIQRATAIEDGANWRKVSRLSGVLPHVTLFADHYFNAQYETAPVTVGDLSLSIPLPYPKTAYGIEASWTLFDGFANWNQLDAAELGKRAARAEGVRKQFEVRKAIELNFYGVLAAIQMAEVAKRNLKTVEENLNRAHYRMANGVSTEPDVLRVEVQRTEAQAEVERTNDNIAIQRQHLREVMGLMEDVRDVNGILPEPGAVEQVSRMQFTGIGDRDDIRALEMKSQAGDRERSAGYGELMPSVHLVGRLESYDNTGYEFSGNDAYRSAYNVGLALRWTILDGGATIAKPGIAAAEANRLKADLRLAQLKAPSEFEMWRRRYLYSANLFQARMKDVKRSEASLRIITLAFQQGSRIINEVLDAETDLFRARAGAVQSQFESIEALTHLELTVGKDIQ